MARGGLAHVHRAAQGRVRRRAPARHDRAVGQRRVDRAGGTRRRFGSRVRRADEQGGRASRPCQHALRQRDRALASAALFDRRRHGSPRGRAHPRLSRVLRAVLAQGVSLQQHHAAESQSPAVDRPVRRRGQDRAYGRGGLVPDRLGEARAAAFAVGRAGSGLRRGADDREPEAPQLRFPGLRYGPALRVGAAGIPVAGVEGRRQRGRRRIRRRPGRAG